MKIAVLPAIVALGLSACATNPPAEAPPAATITPTATELSLENALQAVRHRQGLPALRISPILSAYARRDSDAAAQSGMTTAMDDTDRIAARTGFGTIGKLRGTLKDRGAATGPAFLDYWMKDDPKMLGQGWNEAGIGISRSADGKLHAVVLLGGPDSGVTGGLMSPAMAPAGL